MGQPLEGGAGPFLRQDFRKHGFEGLPRGVGPF